MSLPASATMNTGRAQPVVTDGVALARDSFPAGADKAAANPAADSGQQTMAGLPLLSDSRLARPITQAVLIAGDVAAFGIAYLVFLAFDPGSIDGNAVTRVFILVALAELVLFASEALYPGYRLHGHEHLRRRATAFFKVVGLAAFGAVLLPGGWRLALLIVGFLGVALVVQPITYQIARRVCRKFGTWGERAAIIAGANRIPALSEHFILHWQYGIRPEPFSRDDSSRGKGPRIALIVGDAPLSDELAEMRRNFAEVILLADTPSLKVAGLRPVDVGGQIGVRLALGDAPQAPDRLRRLLDLLIAVPAAVLFTPFVLLAGIGVYLVDPGPVFFWQSREGLAGKTVRVLKLRTMYQDAERRLEALLADDASAQAEWSTHFKLKQDPRILPVVGHLLRSTSFDELPQLLNIITGEMGVVGPRPFPEYHLLAMNAEFRHKRRSITPGLTGLWQISERSNADLELQRQLDEFYIDNRSLWFDWHILLSTIPAVFRRGGAY